MKGILNSSSDVKFMFFSNNALIDGTGTCTLQV